MCVYVHVCVSACVYACVHVFVCLIQELFVHMLVRCPDSENVRMVFGTEYVRIPVYRTPLGES